MSLGQQEHEGTFHGEKHSTSPGPGDRSLLKDPPGSRQSSEAESETKQDPIDTQYIYSHGNPIMSEP
ncbi:hypothetical protein NHX12_002703 [Muraenolepis orangiensis]|uniref:Uncharacterized protein n=1 Tax=Muraenolepis orangiensis TaxID=630683 RepID=A0A9Q0DXJ3_9TELE|nr:hypothetical protein NHX12_002703 [Muraenolepis orangiensis]